MKPPATPLRRLLLGSLLLLALPLAAMAEPHACALLQPAEVAPLFGKPVTGKANGGACAWSPAGGPKKLIVSSMKGTGADAEMAYDGARKNMGMGGSAKVTDEKGIGDKAFSVQASFGVSLMAMKGGRLLNMMFMAGAAGTEKDVAAMRLVAKKAVAAF
jgi:hypothetical protein